jgi:hypothetical protein
MEWSLRILTEWAFGGYQKNSDKPGMQGNVPQNGPRDQRKQAPKNRAHAVSGVKRKINLWTLAGAALDGRIWPMTTRA